MVLQTLSVAQNIVKSLNGQKLSSMPIHYNVQHALSVNMTTANMLGISPPWSVLSEAEMIGGDKGRGYLRPSQISGAENLDEMGLSISEAIKAASFNPKLAALQSQISEKGHQYIQHL